jgi:two-component system phosphate regulon sensor histidine kinase PhoR
MRFHTRVAWLTFTVTVVALGTSTWIWNRSLENERRQELEERLLDQARVLSAILPEPDPRNLPRLDETVRRMHAETRSRLTVIAADGVVLGESDLPPEQVRAMENHLYRPEVQQALRDGFGRASRRSPTLGTPMSYVAVRWGPLQAPYGVVRAALPQTRVVEEATRGRGRILIVVAAALLLSGLLGNLAARRLSRPVIRVSRVANAIAAGDLGRRAELEGSREAKELAAAVNDLARSLEEKLASVEEERHRLAQLLEGMPEGILALDDEGRITLINDAARTLLHLPGEVTGRRPIEVVRSAEMQGAVEDAFSIGKAVAVEIALAEPERLRVSLDIVPMEGGMVILLHDVTRLRRLEEARREMVANIGHELRTPLTAILGYLETLEQDASLGPEEQARFLGVIRRNAKRLESLVRDLSRLSRLESGERALQPEPIQLEDLVREAFETLGPRAEARGIRLRFETSGEVPALHADREVLETALLNLLDNALRVSPDGGEIRVGVGRREDRVLIEVEDEGPGIPRELRDRVFERFYRLDPGRSLEQGGTGLGLAIVKHTVQLHGGRVGIREGSRGGAVFELALPIGEIP